MYNIRQIIDVNVHVSPKATKSCFQPSKRILYIHSSRRKSIAKNLLFFIFFTIGKLIILGKSGYAGCSKIQMGTGGSPSTIILLQSGSTPSLKIAFSVDCHFITTSKNSSCNLLLPEY